MRWPYADYAELYPNALGRRIRKMLLDGAETSHAAYLGLVQRREQIRKLLIGLATRYTAIIGLSANGPAPIGHENTGSRSFALPWSVAGGPAISLPLLSVAGLPLGLQVMTAPGEDAKALWVCGQICSALGGKLASRTDLTGRYSANFRHADLPNDARPQRQLKSAESALEI
jgi:Asp-tRNA(Asn)/Glu-tRNA(Gln) amidotransferase A subunit family amidase